MAKCRFKAEGVALSAGSFRSPFAALVRKEWRESWWLLVLTALAPAGWLMGLMFCSKAEYLPLTSFDAGAPIGFLVLALSLGARLFASKRIQGTAAFQHEQPISRRTMWNATLVLPMLALTTGAVSYGLVDALLWLPPQGRPGSSSDSPMIFAVGLLFFSFGALCSLFVHRPIFAWAAGGVLCLALSIGEGALIDYLIGLEDTQTSHLLFFSGLVVLESCGLLWVCRVACVRWATS
jgi:hypothetical protein